MIGKIDREVHEYEHFARENAKDILALGFDSERTFLFSDYSYMGGDFYRNITRIAKVRSVPAMTVEMCFMLTFHSGSTEERRMHASASTRAPTLARSDFDISTLTQHDGAVD